MIDELSIVEQTGEGRFLVRIVCSRGTYVRTLCEDIATKLGKKAHMSFLLRSRSGMFCVEESYSIAQIASLAQDGRQGEAIMKIEDTLPDMPRIDITNTTHVTWLKTGRTSPVSMQNEQRVCVYFREEFLGLGTVTDGQLKLFLHLYD